MAPDKNAMPETAAAPETIWREAFVLVLESAVEQMVYCPSADNEVETFRKLAKGSLKMLQDATDPQQVLITAGALSQAMTKYLADTQRRIDSLVANSKGTYSESAGASSPSAVDPCTSLPTRTEAEAGLERSLLKASQAYVAVFYLHRMAMINARFGEAMGNQMILFCSQHIASRLTHPNDRLYRWSGPAFLAIIERSEPYLAVSNDVQRMISVPLSRFIETPSRSVYLPMKVTADVFPLFKTTHEEAMRRIERFVINAAGQP